MRSSRFRSNGPVPPERSPVGQAEHPETTGPSWWVRWLVSVLLLAHIAAVFVAINSLNIAGQRWPLPIALWRQRLGGAIRLYLQALQLDYQYRMTHVSTGEGFDLGWYLTAEVTTKDGREVSINLPQQAGGIPLRRQRYNNLIRQLANGEEDPDTQALVARALATGLLTIAGERGIPQEEIASMVMTTRLRLPMSYEQLQAGDQPVFETFYQADVIPTADGPLVSRRRTAFEVAPGLQETSQNEASTQPGSTQTNSGQPSSGQPSSRQAGSGLTEQQED